MCKSYITRDEALWDRLKPFHYRVLRAATCDFKRKKPRILLDKKCKRATCEGFTQHTP